MEKLSNGKEEGFLENLEENKSVSLEDETPLQPELLSNEQVMIEEKKHLVRPSNENLSRLESIRKSNVFVRMFHKMSEGSMRGVTLLFIRLCVGVGILTLPYYMRVFGGLVGGLMLFLAAAVNYLMYVYLIEVGNDSGIQDFLILTKRFTPLPIQKLFKFTFLFDLVSAILFYMIMVYNMFEYLLSFTNLPPASWYKPDDSKSFKTYHPPVILLRFIYNVVSVIVLLPFMFKKDLGALQTMSNYYLLVLLVLCIFIFIEMGFFRVNLQKMDDYKVEYLSTTPSGEWLESFFGVMLAYYAQQYFFSIRNELMHPTTKRLKKTTFLSMGSLFFICIFLGILFWGIDFKVSSAIFVLETISLQT